MKHYIAIIEPGDEKHAYGVRFPDLPAVHSASDEGLEDAIKQAGIALRFYAEDIDDMPDARSFEAIVKEAQSDPEHNPAAAFVAIPFFVDSERVVKITLTVPAGVKEAIDATAKARGQSRSAFMTSAAKQVIENSLERELEHA